MTYVFHLFMYVSDELEFAQMLLLLQVWDICTECKQEQENPVWKKNP